MTVSETESKYLHDVILEQNSLNLLLGPNKNRLLPSKSTFFRFVSLKLSRSAEAIVTTEDFFLNNKF